MIDKVAEKLEMIRPMPAQDRDRNQCGVNCYYVQICKDFGLKMIMNNEDLNDYQKAWGPRVCDSQEIRDIVWDISVILFNNGIGPEPIKKIEFELDGVWHYGLFIEHVTPGYPEDYTEDECRAENEYLSEKMINLGWDWPDLHKDNIAYKNGKIIAIDGVGSVFDNEESVEELKDIIYGNLFEW
jgi:hypothetical protein